MFRMKDNGDMFFRQYKNETVKREFITTFFGLSTPLSHHL